jgi:hypothetical protein
MQAERVLEARRDRVEHRDVGARAEELLALPREHHDLHRVVETRAQHGLVEVAHHLVRVAVGRRVRQREQGDASIRGVGHLAVRQRLGSVEGHAARLRLREEGRMF